MEAHSNVR
jgi:protein phosphatase 2C family protein 2/3